MPNGAFRTIGRGFAGLGRGLRAAGRGLHRAAPRIASVSARLADVLGSPEALQEEYRQKAAVRQQVLDEMAQEREGDERGLRRLQRRKFTKELALIPGSYEEKERRRFEELEEMKRLEVKYRAPFTAGPEQTLYTMQVPEEGGAPFASPLYDQPPPTAGDLPEGAPGEELTPLSRGPKRAPTLTSLLIRRGQGIASPAELETLNVLLKRQQPPGNWRPFVSAAGSVVGFFNTKTLEVRGAGAAVGLRLTPLSGMEATRRGALNSMIRQASQLRGLVKTDEVKTALGSFPSIRNWLYSIKEVTVGDAENRVAFRRIADNLAELLLRARSGAQINEQEYTRLRKLMPTPNVPLSTFNVRLRLFMDEVNTLIETRRTGKLEGPSSASPPLSNDQIADSYDMSK